MKTESEIKVLYCNTCKKLKVFIKNICVYCDNKIVLFPK